MYIKKNNNNNKKKSNKQDYQLYDPAVLFVFALLFSFFNNL